MTIKVKRYMKAILNKCGIDISFHKETPFYSDALKAQKWIFKKMNIDDLLIFDVGANIGEETFHYHKAFPNAIVYSFEPYPETAEKLKNTVGHKNILVFQLGVAEDPGERKLNINTNSDVNSFYKRPTNCRSYFPTDGEYIDEIKVPTVSLDQFVQDNDLAKINILKIDVEGGELAVLNGAHELLSHSKIDVIFLEIGFVQRFEDEPYFTQIFSFLRGFGYTVYNLYELVSDNRNGQLKRVNALMVSEHIREEIDRY